MKIRRDKFLLTVGAVAGAWLCNSHPFTVLDSVTVLVSGWLVFLVALATPPLWATLAAVAAYLPATRSGIEPWVVALYALEAAALSYGVRRWQRPVVTLGLFWAVIGSPIAAVMVLGVEQPSFPGNWLTVLHFPLLSGLMLMVALPLHRSSRMQRWLGEEGRADHATPLRRILFRRFGMITAAAVTALSLGLARFVELEMRASAHRTLEADANEAARDLETRLRAHQEIIDMIARQAQGENAPLADLLEGLHGAHPGFLTALATDTEGRIIAAAPLSVQLNHQRLSPVGQSVADRDYFQRAMAGEKFVSDVFRGRGFGHELIVAISQPIRGADGRVRGVVEGSLNLRRLLDTRSLPLYLQDRSFVVVDAAGRVVVSGGGFARPELERFHDSPLQTAAARARGQTFLFDDSEEREPERLIVAQAKVPTYRWRVLLAEPVWRKAQVAALIYATSFAAAALALGIALVFARHTAADLTGHLGKIVAAIREIAQGSGHVPELPAFSRDLNALGQAARGAALALRQANSELAQALADRDRSHADLQQVLGQMEEQVRQRTRELEVALRMARSANEAKTAFLASMSHELRTPLNAVLGLSRLALDGAVGPLNDRQTECLRTIEESGEHLLALINDVLDLAKVEAGKLELHRAPISIEAVCEASLRLVRPQSAQKQQELRVAYRMQSETVFADELRLKQMLVNLLGNAVKFTPERGHILLDVWETPATGVVHFTVADDGPGISPENIARLFRRFEQVDQQSNRSHGGAGLGLALVRTMAELHGGRVEVQSRVGKGSRFTLALPTHAATETVAPSDALPAGTRVLIAEDNWANRRLYEKAPIFARCEVHIVGNGLEAIQHARVHRPDIILMDVEMPELDGIEATRILHREPATRDVPIIIVTAYVNPEHEARGREAGAVHFVAKPLNLRRLAADMRDLLHRRPPASSA